MGDCLCPEAWWEIIGSWSHMGDECPRYTTCGGWTWDPPCGGCDYCIQAQESYYNGYTLGVDNPFTQYTMWRAAQLMNA